MIIDMFILKILTIMNGHMTSHSVYEFLEVEKNNRDAVAAYEAIVMGNIL